MRLSPPDRLFSLNMVKATPEAAPRKKRSRYILFLLLLLLGGGAWASYKTFGPNTGHFQDGAYLYIPTGSRYDEVKHLLKTQGFIKDLFSFDLLARQAKYPDLVKAGKFRVEKGISNYELIRMLRSGKQVSVKIVLNKIRTSEDLIQLFSSRLEPSPGSFARLLGDTAFLAPYGLTSETALCAFLPDTYEFWWNTTAEAAFKKLAGYYTRFWNENRRQKAAEKGLTPQQAVTLASIVEEETRIRSEMPEIASVYLNRLRKGMKLQADPTAKYAAGDFSLKRITSLQTGLPSPYNTYYVQGLPPGPICTPMPGTIDAVLQAPETRYLYFCAAEDFSGQHRFATTYAEHRQNARRYHQALNAAGIR